jgi:hypothetical protein
MHTKSLIALSIALSALAGCSGGGLPSCTSSEVKGVIEEIAAEKSYLIGNFVNLKNIKESAFNEDAQIRTCTANLITTKSDKNIFYSVTWGDAEHKQFRVEIRRH